MAKTDTTSDVAPPPKATEPVAPIKAPDRYAEGVRAGLKKAAALVRAASRFGVTGTPGIGAFDRRESLARMLEEEAKK